MAMSAFVELVLTCASWQEAQKIADALLEKHLVACVEFMEIKSQYHWHGQREEADEVKLIMETRVDNFDAIEAEISKLHSYDTFVLQKIPITKLSSKAKQWLGEEAKS